jgi:molybdate transport system substrate-binding protein
MKIRNSLWPAALAATFFALLVGCSRRDAEPQILTIAAAASLKDALPPLAEEFEKTHPNTLLRISSGSSGALQSQIENGAPIDVFVAASAKNMDALERANHIKNGTRREFARGELVLIAPRESKIRTLSDLKSPNVKRVALGARSVPAGEFARQALGFLKLERAIQPKQILGKDVRAVLTLVRSGEADAGFVYRSDAISAPEVRVVASVPPQAHDPIIYPIAVVANSKSNKFAREFVEFVTTTEAQQSLKKQGFKATEEHEKHG